MQLFEVSVRYFSLVCVRSIIALSRFVSISSVAASNVVEIGRSSRVTWLSYDRTFMLRSTSMLNGMRSRIKNRIVTWVGIQPRVAFSRAGTYHISDWRSCLSAHGSLSYLCFLQPFLEKNCHVAIVDRIEVSVNLLVADDRVL
jgi:hypothetical protein